MRLGYLGNSWSTCQIDEEKCAEIAGLLVGLIKVRFTEIRTSGGDVPICEEVS